MDKVILLDNGHGENTLGKCSPDNSLLEWKYTRRVAKKIQEKLAAKGYNVHILVPEDNDIALGERCKRVNKFVAEYGKDNVVLISIHCNAAGSDGKWHKAKGWQVHTFSSPSDESIRLANILFDTVSEMGLKTRRPMPSQNYWTNDFWILKHSKCPAVLTENFFQDNKEDVEFLLSEEGFNSIVKLHVDAIMKYCK